MYLLFTVNNKIICINNSANISSTRNRVPYSAIFHSASVWAVWCAAIGNSYGIQLLLQFTPIYLHHVLGYSVLITGYASAGPQILAFVIKIFSGIISDRIVFFNETDKVRLFNSIAVGGTSICYLLLAMLPNTQKG